MTQTQAHSRADHDVLARLGELGAATVYEANGQTGAFDAGLKPLDPTRTLVGRAVTLDLPPADNWYIHVAMLEVGPGDVLVVDAKGFLEEFPLTYPSYEDPDERIARDIGAPANYPITVFYDARGRRAFVRQGGYGSEAKLERDIDRYLG